MNTTISFPLRQYRAVAFTLVELLTVIAIIGILAAIIIPTVSAVRQKANFAQSASNLRQIGAAFHLYAHDNKDSTPGKGQNTVYIIDSTVELTNNNRILHRDLNPYVAYSVDTWHSRADKAYWHKFHNGTATSYAHNLGDFFVNSSGGVSFSTDGITLTQMQANVKRSISKHPIFAEADWETVMPTTTISDGSRINDEYNVCFLDGHVARYKRTTTQGRYRSDW